MRVTLALLLLSLTAGTCAEDPAPTTPILYHGNAAIRDWVAHGNKWNYVRCTEYQLGMYVVPQSALPAYCGVDANLWACLQGNTVYLAREIDGTVRADYVVEHELRHWLGGCAYGSVDGGHTDTRYWYQYCGGAAGCQDIRE